MPGDSPRTLWALVVGVEHYNIEGYRHLRGPTIDVQGVEAFLLNNLPIRVKLLKLVDPSRDEFTSAFTSHLIKNRSISQDDPLLFYFSGHGTQLPAPANWPVTPVNGKNLLEAILFKDCNKNSISAVPDRTLNSLIRRAARDDRNSVTVILDCCHAHHATRDQGGQVRSIPGHLLCPLSEDTDKEIWGQEQEGWRGVCQSKGLGDISGRSHVLLAACGQTETAFSWPEKGGAFTNALLAALRSYGSNVLFKTYLDIIQSVQKMLVKFEQTPGIMGWYQDRLLFNSTVAKGRIPVFLEDGKLLIRSGFLHGIAKDAEFSLFDRMDINRPQGQVRPQHVFATFSTAEFGGGFTPSYATIKAKGTGQTLKVFISPEGLERYAGTLQQLLRGSEEFSPIVRATSEEDANVIIRVDNSSKVVLEDKNPLLSDRGIIIPPITSYASSPENFLYCLSQISMFNTHLNFVPKESVFRRGIRMDLGKFPDHEVETFTRVQKTKTLSSGDSIDYNILISSAGDYGLVITNNTSRSLFFSLLQFDPESYYIAPIYRSLDGRPIQPGSSFQLGRSNEKSCFAFGLDEGTDVGVVYLKLYITTRNDNFDSLEQDGINSEGSAARDPDKLELMSYGDEWDAIRIKVVVTSK